MTHKYTGAVAENIGPDETIFSGAARLLVQQIFDTLNAPPFNGKGNLMRSKTVGNATVTASVNTLGLTPRVYTWVVAPKHERTEPIPPEGTPFPYVFLSTVWEPEGLIITPRCEDAPYGFRFPKRHPGTGARMYYPFGTTCERVEESVFGQVLINNYANNKYLDHPDHIAGPSIDHFLSVTKLRGLPANPCLRDLATVDPAPGWGFYHQHIKRYEGTMAADVFESWPPGTYKDPPDDFYADDRGHSRAFWNCCDHNIEYIDTPGINVWADPYAPFLPALTTETGEPLLRQFDGPTNLIYEEESSDWYCHWPEENLYSNDAYEAIFQHTNFLRGTVRSPLLHRPIRGDASLAWLTAVEMARSGTMFHNIPEDKDIEEYYRWPYRSLWQRYYGTDPMSVRVVGENLAGATITGLSYDSGQLIAEAWETSPGHYANMIDTRWGWPYESGTLDVAGGMPTIFTESGDPHPATYDPPIVGMSMYAQEFFGYEEGGYWLYPCTVYNYTDWGNIGGRYFTSLVGYTWYTSDSYYVSTRGRTYFHYPNYEYHQTVFEDEENQEPGGDTDRRAVIMGATHFAKEGWGSMPWIRVVSAYFEDDEFPTFRVHETARSSVDELGDMYETAFIVLGEGYPYEVKSSRSASKMMFSMDGTKGVMSISVPAPDTGEYFFPLASNELTPMRYDCYWIHYDHEAGFSLELAEQPDYVCELTTYDDIESNLTKPSKYTQKIDGSVKIYPFYDGSKLKWITHNVILDIVQYAEGFGENDVDAASFVHKQKMVFPSGKEFYIIHQDFLDGLQRAGTECYIRTLLYMDPRTETIVYIQGDIDRENTGVYMTNTLWVNDTKIFEWPRALVHTGSAVGPASYISGSWPIGDPPVSPRLSNLYDMVSYRNTDASGKYRPVPYQDTSGVWFCERKPEYWRYRGNPLVGTWKTSFRPLRGRGFPCTTLVRSEDSVLCSSIESFNIAPAVIDRYGDDDEDYVVCYTAEYKDRIVVDVRYKECHKVPAKDESGTDRIMWASFPLEDEVGMGKLTSIYPVGVV